MKKLLTVLLVLGSFSAISAEVCSLVDRGLNRNVDNYLDKNPIYCTLKTDEDAAKKIQASATKNEDVMKFLVENGYEMQLARTGKVIFVKH